MMQGWSSSVTQGNPIGTTVYSPLNPVGLPNVSSFTGFGTPLTPLNTGPEAVTPEPPQWDLNQSKQITNDEANAIPRFIISRACGSSLTKAVELLNLLGSSWPHDFAICYSAKVSSFYMLAKKEASLSLADAKEAHRKFFGKDSKDFQYRKKEDRQKYPLEARLQKRLVGQKNAIFSVAGQIRRKENGWQSSNHPLVFLFMGSSGIGKTELAKQVAEYMHEDNGEGFIRIDMTEYQHQHEVSKFIGAPPGYAGYDDGGQLTKRLRRCPNAVVLFDEVEKAHPDILTCLLQTFDEGRLTDGKGELVECMDAIFVMTSNLAQREIADEAIRARSKMENPDDPNAAEPISEDFKDKVILPILKQNFKRDEFIGRIKEILFFLPFTEEQLRALARGELQKWKTTAYDRHKIVLEWDRDVEGLLCKAYNVRFGVRSIQHEVERKVVNRLAQAHERDYISTGTHVKLAVSPSDPSDIAMYKVEKEDEQETVKEVQKEPLKKK
eukprot:GGOE01005338.1.p1 GENE.GGOE01005338.1~~GGOE01005338.1.p1  ORF type:complete len:496 (-),score=115.49 GGOE01005338.1:424-1911(-)